MPETKERQMHRFTFDIDPDVHAAIKVAAAKARTTMREYLTTSALRRIEDEERAEREALKAS